MAAKISPKRRSFEIKRKRERRKKIRKLKEQYKNAKTRQEKEKILAKLRKINPHYPLDEFLK